MELLMGTLELDAKMRISKADPLAGVLLGRPATALAKHSLSRFLDMPRDGAWEDIFDGDGDGARAARHGARRHASLRGGMVTPLTEMGGRHPDGGTLPMLVQGCAVPGGKGAGAGAGAGVGGSRAAYSLVIKPNLNPASGAGAGGAADTIWSVLGIDCFDDDDGDDAGAQAKRDAREVQQRQEQSGDDDDDGDAEDDGDGDGRNGDRDEDGAAKPAFGSAGGSQKTGDSNGDGGDDGSRLKAELLDAFKAVNADGPKGRGPDFMSNWMDSLATAGGADGEEFTIGSATDGGGEGEGGEGGGAESDNGSPRRRIGFQEEEEDPGAKSWMKMAEEMEDEAGAEVKPPPRRGKRGAKARRNSLPSGGDGSGGDGTDGGDADANAAGGEDQNSEASGMSSEQRASDFASASEAGHAEEVLVDSRRGKVLRKLLSLLQQAKLTAPVVTLQRVVYLLLLVALLIRVVALIVVAFSVAGQEDVVALVAQTSRAADRSQVLASQVRLLAFCKSLGAGALAADTACASTVPLAAASADVGETVSDLESFAQSVYLGLNGAVTKLEPGAYGVWSKDKLTVSIYLDTVPPITLYEKHPLWDLSLRFAAAGREMLWGGLNLDAPALAGTRPYNFLIDNAPGPVYHGFLRAADVTMVYAWSEFMSVRATVVVLFVVEALVVVPAVMAAVWWLLRRAEAVRTAHWTLMASLPPPAVKALCNRPIKICDNSDDESGDDEEEENQRLLKAQRDAEEQRAGGGGGGSGGFAGGGGGAGGKLESKTNKAVAPSVSQYVVFLAPMGLWVVVLVALYALMIARATSLRDPLTSLHMVHRVLSRFSHVRLSATMLATAASDAEKDAWKASLSAGVGNLTGEYNALMFGGLAATQDADNFRHATPSAAFVLPAFSDAFFSSTACFAYDPVDCHPPDSPWYEPTRRGLDAMLQRVLKELGELAADDNAVITYDSSRVDALYHVGMRDLYDGLRWSAQLFGDHVNSEYEALVTLQIIALVLLLVCILPYVLFVVRPYMRLHVAQVKRVAGLLSHAPTEVDVHGHAKRVIRRIEKAAERAKRGPKRASAAAAGTAPLLTAGPSAMPV